MIDPLLTLSFNLHSQKGIYALLLGSGVSRKSGIPTGWEVTIDLIRKLAHLQNERCYGDEINWYAKKYNKEPDYSELLPALASTSAAQQHLLKGYFEPTPEEREEGKKLPTLAHKVIAKLVAGGYIKVIVTTNFDRLLESALEAEGVSPVIIDSPDSAKGAPPVAHSICTIIKVHGDYLDHRIKNSQEALSNYEKPINQILDQVFNEYGLIICGWSGDYDVALRKAIEKSKTRRYPMYWTGISDPSSTANRIIALHNAHFLKIEEADTFFSSLFEKVEALEEFDRPHPISIQAAIATLKKYLSENKTIQLRDFLRKEAEQTRDALEKIFLNIHATAPNKDSFLAMKKKIEASCEKLIHLFVNGSYHAKPDQIKEFFDAFSVIAGMPTQSFGLVHPAWDRLKKYPILLLSYATGLAAFAAENYSLLNEITSRHLFVSSEDNKKNVPIQINVYAHSVVEPGQAKELINDRYTPFSDYLFNFYREAFRSFTANEVHYEKIFDEFEYTWCLLHVDGKKYNNFARIWTPYGSFVWRRREKESEWLQHLIKRSIEESDNSFILLKNGMFGRSLNRLKEAYDYAQPKLEEIGSKILW